MTTDTGGEECGYEGDLTLVGTAHVSEDSADEVRERIREEEPDVVAVELDHRRYESVSNLRGTDAEYGVDMLAAVEEADDRDIPVALIDRDIRVTLVRFWREMSFVERLKVLGALVAGALGFGAVQTRDVEEVLENDRVQAYVDELREFSPSGARVIIDERDAYMAKRLLELGRRGDDVVAVVGAGHEAGVEEYLRDPASIPDVVETVEGISPKADVLENSDEVKVVVDLPGCSEDEIDIRFSDGLVVEASPEKPFEPGYHYSEEGRPRSFETTVEVPRDVEPESATAEYKKGALHVHLPKPE